MNGEQQEFWPADPTPKKAWKEETFIGFDTETSGRFPLLAEVVELAAVKWKDGQIIEKFESFVRPSRPMDPEAIRIHGITDEMVADAPLMEDVLKKFRDFIGDESVLIAHHAPFDMGFLALEFVRYGMPLPQNKVICTSLLSIQTHPKLENHRLVTLIEHFAIKVDARHRALEDSRACLEVALRLMESLGETVSTDFVLKTQGGPLEWTKYSVADLESHPVYGPLVEASRKRLVVEFTYAGGGNPGVPRRMTAQGIVRTLKWDYVVGFCHIENKDKKFYLNRILSAKILD